MIFDSGLSSNFVLGRARPLSFGTPTQPQLRQDTKVVAYNKLSMEAGHKRQGNGRSSRLYRSKHGNISITRVERVYRPVSGAFSSAKSLHIIPPVLPFKNLTLTECSKFEYGIPEQRPSESESSEDQEDQEDNQEGETEFSKHQDKLAEVEIFTQPYLSPGEIVCAMYDFVTSLSNDDKKKRNIKDIFRGQVGIINFAIMTVDLNSMEKLESHIAGDKLSLVKTVESKMEEKVQNLDHYPEEIFYSVDFIDLKLNNDYPDDIVFETLIIQRKHLLALREELLYPPKEENPKEWKNVIEKPFCVKTELQLEAMNEKNTEYKDFLNIYNYKSLLHDKFSDYRKVGEIVTVQEVLYEHNDIDLNYPIVWPGQIGIILTLCEKEEVEVIFLDKNMRELLYYSNNTDIISKDLKEIYTNNAEREFHKEVRIKIEKKFLLPLYAQQLQLSPTDEHKHLIEELKNNKVLKEPIERTIYNVKKTN